MDSLLRIILGYLIVILVCGILLNYVTYGYFIPPETKDNLKSLFRKDE